MHGTVSRRVLLLALAPLCPLPVFAAELWKTPQLLPVPGRTPLNPHIIDLARSYPFGDRHPYIWTPGTHTDGTTRDLQVRGTPVATRSSDGAIHCSGITFEVWLRALEQVGVPSSLTAEEVLRMKETWYVRDGGRLGPVEALSSRGLGLRVDRIEDLQPGDLVQFWRNSGKGHSAIFVHHRHRRDGSVRGLAFWSAQSASAGIGIRYASFGPGEHQLESLYGVRPVVPVVG